MERDSGTGFVLRTWPLRESDLIVSAFTLEHGKIRGVARGARSLKGRWLGALDPMTEVAFQWRGREGEELLTLVEGSIVRSPYSGSAPPLGVTWTLAYVAELVDSSTGAHDEDETLYRLLRAAVDALAAGAPHRVIASYVTAWVLRLHGVLPDVDRCAGCGRTLARGGRWHWKLHGIGCASCAPASSGGPALRGDDLRFLDELRRRPPRDVASPAPAILRRSDAFLRQLVHELTGRPLNSERFLDELDALDAVPGAKDGQS